ncbi:MAG: ATP-binding protein [Bacillota bacterium]|nr:ATP-binding protein [Bacillota bacterium]
MDWSKEIVEDASMDDLDSEAVARARELFSKRQNDRKKAQEILNKLSDIEVLNKAGITIKGKITRTALVLLGNSESAHYFDGFIPRITWTLYNADNSVKAYEHFDMPMLLAVDKVYSRIRNIKYRYIAGQQTLFPDEVDQYEPELIKEIINNCIAHQDYRLRGKINVEEFEDKLVFINEGAFIPETIEQALEPGYKPPYYRNVFLCNAMVNLYMIDTNSMGIPMMYQIQRDKCFPLPTYDLNTINRVKVTVYGKILDKNYTQLLYSDTDLNMRTVFLLDQVQKHEVISKESFKNLKKRGLIEGRYPNIFVSFKVADIVGQKAEYVRNKGLNDDICKQLIIKALESMGEAGKQELMEVLEKVSPEVLNDEQKSKKVSNLLQAMKKENIIMAKGRNRYAKWYIVNK